MKDFREVPRFIQEIVIESKDDFIFTMKYGVKSWSSQSEREIWNSWDVLEVHSDMHGWDERCFRGDTIKDQISCEGIKSELILTVPSSHNDDQMTIWCCHQETGWEWRMRAIHFLHDLPFNLLEKYTDEKQNRSNNSTWDSNHSTWY
jgi:hypothetical protein